MQGWAGSAPGRVPDRRSSHRDGFAEDALTECAAQGVGCDHVDVGLQEVAECESKADLVEHGGIGVEIDEDVEV